MDADFLRRLERRIRTNTVQRVLEPLIRSVSFQLPWIVFRNIAWTHTVTFQLLDIKNGYALDVENQLSGPDALAQVKSTVERLLNLGGRLLQQYQDGLTNDCVAELQECLERLKMDGEFLGSVRIIIPNLGNAFLKVGQVFVTNTSDKNVRKDLSDLGQILLLAVVELLFAADNVEIRKIQESVEIVSEFNDGFDGSVCRSATRSGARRRRPATRCSWRPPAGCPWTLKN